MLSDLNHIRVGRLVLNLSPQAMLARAARHLARDLYRALHSCAPPRVDRPLGPRGTLPQKVRIRRLEIVLPTDTDITQTDTLAQAIVEATGVAASRALHYPPRALAEALAEKGADCAPPPPPSQGLLSHAGSHSESPALDGRIGAKIVPPPAAAERAATGASSQQSSGDEAAPEGGRTDAKQPNLPDLAQDVDTWSHVPESQRFWAPRPSPTPTQAAPVGFGEISMASKQHIPEAKRQVGSQPTRYHVSVGDLSLWSTTSPFQVLKAGGQAAAEYTLRVTDARRTMTSQSAMDPSRSLIQKQGGACPSFLLHAVQSASPIALLALQRTALETRTESLRQDLEGPDTAMLDRPAEGRQPDQRPAGAEHWSTLLPLPAVGPTRTAQSPTVRSHRTQPSLGALTRASDSPNAARDGAAAGTAPQTPPPLSEGPASLGVQSMDLWPPTPPHVPASAPPFHTLAPTGVRAEHDLPGLHTGVGGLVLLHVFFKRFFAALDLTRVGPDSAPRFTSLEAAQRGAALIWYAATGQKDFGPEDTVLPAHLVGLPPHLAGAGPLQPDQTEEAIVRMLCESALQVLVEDTLASVEALRQAVLLRSGRLLVTGGPPRLILARHPIDTVLDELGRLPARVQLPWMPDPLLLEYL